MRKDGSFDSANFAKEYKDATDFSKAMDAADEDRKIGKLTRKEEEELGWRLYTKYQSELGRKWLSENAEKYGYIFTEGVI